MLQRQTLEQASSPTAESLAADQTSSLITTPDNAPTVHEKPALPVSPLMDPDVIAAKEKYHAKKLRPSKNPEIFQQILSKNPYAQALATPIRRCQLTHSALPSFFLQGFNLMAHPETGDPWYLPRSLTNKKAPVGKIGLEDDNEPDLDMNDEAEHTSGPAAPTLGHTVYTLGYQYALRAMQDPKGYKKKPNKQMKYKAKRGGIAILEDAPPIRFIPDRYGQSKSANKFLSTARWRSDMHELVLELMRRRLVEGLTRLAKLKRGYVVGCSGWDDALAKPQVGAFIWTGGDGVLEEEANIPQEFATLDVSVGLQEENRTKKIPVYNLRRLLGTEKLAELRAKLPSGIFGREIVVLRHKQVVVDVEMRLWKLQGYLAEYRDLYQDAEERPEQDVEDGDEEDDEDFEKDEDDEEERGRDSG